jgi:serine/threonine protein kinase
MLNEKSDVYSFGIVLLETVTGRDPVDYSRHTSEVLVSSVGINLFYSFSNCRVYLLAQYQAIQLSLCACQIFSAAKN